MAGSATSLEIEQLAGRLFASWSPEEREGLTGIEVLSPAASHPFLEGEVILSELSPEPAGSGEARIRLHAGSFAHLQAKERDFDLSREVEAALVFAADRHHEDRGLRSSIPGEEALYHAHAAFLRDQRLPAGWWRRGEVLAPCLFAVDLDLLAELWLRPRMFRGLKGTTLTLQLPGEPLPIAIDADADPSEAWVVAGQGRGEVVEGEEAMEGRRGDLYVIPLLLPEA